VIAGKRDLLAGQDPGGVRHLQGRNGETVERFREALSRLGSEVLTTRKGESP
jgi:hypothetical protein